MARTIAKDHDEKRARILASAARVFAETGFDRASMAQAAAAAGVSKANIYHYYPGKDALLYDILESHLRGLRDILRDAPRGDTARAGLRAALAAVLCAYEGADDAHRVQTAGFAMLPEVQQAVLRGYQRDMVRDLSARIAACAPPDLAADRQRLHGVTMSVFGMLNWFYMWQPGAGPAARGAYAGLVADLTLGGLDAV